MTVANETFHSSSKRWDGPRMWSALTAPQCFGMSKLKRFCSVPQFPLSSVLELQYFMGPCAIRDSEKGLPNSLMTFRTPVELARKQTSLNRFIKNI